MNIWTLRSRWPKDFHKIRKIAHNYETCFCSSHSLEFLGREKFTAVCAWHARFFHHCISKSKILAVYYFLPKVEKSYSKYQKHFFQAKKVAIAKKKKRLAIYFWKNYFLSKKWSWLTCVVHVNNLARFPIIISEAYPKNIQNPFFASIGAEMRPSKSHDLALFFGFQIRKFLSTICMCSSISWWAGASFLLMPRISIGAEICDLGRSISRTN